jgi:AcrR family transcriptional regulator
MASRAQRRKTRSRLPPDERISRIIAEARKVLAEKGYERFVTAEVAARCGISEAAIYKYFATKRDLLIRVAEHWFAELLASHAGAPPADQSTYRRLRHVIWESLEVIRQEPALSRFVLMELRSDPRYREMHIFQLNRRFTGRMIAVLEDAVASGEYHTDVTVRLLRNVVFGAIEHQTWGFLRGEGDFDVDEAANGLALLIHRGMSRRPAQAEKSASRRQKA